jgi:hypothetical protein
MNKKNDTHIVESSYLKIRKIILIVIIMNIIVKISKKNTSIKGTTRSYNIIKRKTLVNSSLYHKE